MSFILTHTGRRFYPLAPRAEDLSIEDIAHALAHVCRFAGHVKFFYSVAQHCILASHLVSPEHALAALLHDASEAYLCDVARPVKQHASMTAYRDAEHRINALVDAVFKVNIQHPAVTEVDDRLLATERRDLMPASAHWPVDHAACYPTKIRPWIDARYTRRTFMARFEALT